MPNEFKIRPQEFIFESFGWDQKLRQIELKYSFDGKIRFTETFTLPDTTNLNTVDKTSLNNAIFALHLAAGVSYYKSFCPPKITIKSGQLTPSQANFWNIFYQKGLGEFFYQNKIDFGGLINFPAQAAEIPLPPQTAPPKPSRALVPFGGGKDSVVTMELLRAAGIEQTLFRLREHHFINRLAEKTGLPLLNIERALDPQILELNNQGAYNGHVPITGVISFLSIVIALLSGHDSVWFSNERSADYGNVTYLGETVNHQWSKSLEAEELMRGYIQRFVTGQIQYLNMLRPLGELKIAQIFAAHKKYFSTTTSCNVNWRLLQTAPADNPWCGKCYKCAFIFALYAAVLPDDTAVKMFGKNMLDDTSLLHTYRQLWGQEGIKPFDCVGTPEEMQAAMYLALKKPAFAKTAAGRDFVRHMLPLIPDPQKLVQESLKPDFHGVPQIVRDALKGVV